MDLRCGDRRHRPSTVFRRLNVGYSFGAMSDPVPTRRSAVVTIGRSVAAVTLGGAYWRALGDERGGGPGTQGSPGLLIRGGRVVNADGMRTADVRTEGERIVEIAP